MKIGVDASRLTRKDRTGTENYLYYLLRTFSRMNIPHEFVLYFAEHPDPNFWMELTAGNSNFSFKVLKKFGSWTQVSLSYELFKNSPDVLFCPWHTMPGLNPFWKMKTVATVHDITGRFIPTFWTSMFANSLIAVSNSVKADLRTEYSVKGEKVDVIGEGFDVDAFRGNSTTNISEIKGKYKIKNEYVFFLGSISSRKNIENMVEAFNSIDSNLEFVLGGDVLPGHEQLTHLDATFIGRVDQEDLPALYSGARFFAFVSKEEGFGIPVLEAMASSTPVLTANVSATKEIAGGAALLVDPASVEDIAGGMKNLIEDAELRENLIEKGLERIKDFSWKKAAEETLEVFERVAHDS